MPNGYPITCPDSFWNRPYNIAQLKELWAQGLTCNKIAAEMGISRNAVIGKAHRLKLHKRPNPVSSMSLEAKRRRWEETNRRYEKRMNKKQDDDRRRSERCKPGNITNYKLTPGFDPYGQHVLVGKVFEQVSEGVPWKKHEVGV